LVNITPAGLPPASPSEKAAIFKTVIMVPWEVSEEFCTCAARRAEKCLRQSRYDLFQQDSNSLSHPIMTLTIHKHDRPGSSGKIVAIEAPCDDRLVGVDLRMQSNPRH
jgi:hypothetical protein